MLIPRWHAYQSTTLFAYRRQTDKLHGGLQPIRIVSVPLPESVTVQGFIGYLPVINQSTTLMA
jgi:hypothetical protein